MLKKRLSVKDLRLIEIFIFIWYKENYIFLLWKKPQNSLNMWLIMGKEEKLRIV